MRGPSEEALEAAIRVGEDGMWFRAHQKPDAPTTRELFTACVEAAYPIIVAEIAEALRDKAEAADKAPRSSYKQGYVRGTYEAAAFIEADD
jgi:hypothetical protein